jgi:hypothetical protein
VLKHRGFQKKMENGAGKRKDISKHGKGSLVIPLHDSRRLMVDETRFS